MTRRRARSWRRGTGWRSSGGEARVGAAGPSGGGDGGEGDEPPEYDAAAARKAKLEELWVELEQEYKALAKRVWPDEA